MLTVDFPARTRPGHAAAHAVRFYDAEQQMLDEVAEFLDTALRSGGHAAVIATAGHRAELSRRLAGFGGPPGHSPGWLRGEILMLDAAETLDLFMRDGMPDARLFEAVIAPVLQKAAAGKELHVFGEMVSVLCERGQYEAALALEGLWDQLVERHRFSLFCAYPRRLFPPEHEQAFRRICAAHDSVLNAVDGAVVPQQADPALELAQQRQQVIALRSELQRRMEAEATLRKREAELTEFLENACEGIHKVGADGKVLYANRAELEMLGYRWDEYVGRNIVDFHADRRVIERILQRLLAGEVLRDEPAVMVAKDGAHKPVLIYSSGYFEGGELRYTRCFTRDATERVARDDAFVQRNNLILQAPVGAALLMGPELRFELANDEYCKMLGRRDIAGRTFAEVFPELVGTASEHLLREVMRTGEPYSAEEYSTQIDLGAGVPEERIYRLSLQPLRSPVGLTEGIIGVCVDITEQVRARQTLQRSAAEREQLLQSLREASRVKDEFLAMLGHELRNPLSPIVTALQLMRMRGDTGTAREQAVIQRQVDHLVRLVDDLLDISRITRGKIELKRERADVSAMLAKAVEQASVLLEQRSHRLQVDVEPGLQCDCDPVRMAQVVANLLTNSARYTQPGGEIRLRARRDAEDWMVISVDDNGSGIAPELLPQVFELFFQGQRGVDRAEGGLGIGLALVRSLVELHGGSVEARSAGKGQGSEFTVRLPLSSAAAAHSPPVGRQAASAAAGRGKRVMLVDDNKDAAETMGELLRQHGHAVTVFTDPVSALRSAPELKPEVALLDIGLPVMDGYELGAKLREICGESCRLVAVTGYGQDADRSRSRAAGFRCHLVKPVPPQEVIDVLEGIDARVAAAGAGSPS